MENMLVVALLVVSCICINPFISASETGKVAATEQTQTNDQTDETGDESDEEEEEEEPSN